MIHGMAWTRTIDDAREAGLALDLADGVAHLSLQRPPGNRFSLALLEALHALLGELAARPGLHVVLLTASGADFSHGADFGDAALAQRMAGSREDRRALAALGQETIDRWAGLPVPTVIAARGRILGAGACFFSTADFALAHPEATLQFPEVDRGMHLSWGMVPRLVARFGLPWATQLALTGERVACNRLPQPPLQITDEPEATAADLAAGLAAKPPLAVQAITAVLRKAGQGLQQAAARDAEAFADTVASADFAEAMAAWFEKRAGRFTGQ